MNALQKLQTGKWSAWLDDRGDRSIMLYTAPHDTPTGAINELWGLWREVGSPELVLWAADELQAVEARGAAREKAVQDVEHTLPPNFRSPAWQAERRGGG